LVVVGEDEDLILDCYRLAHYFHVDPNIFLDKPLSEVAKHLRWAIKLSHALADEARSSDDFDG
jgi:hypothetical protein